MSRESLIDCIKRELRRQGLVIRLGDDPDTYHVRGVVDLVKLAQAIQEYR